MHKGTIKIPVSYTNLHFLVLSKRSATECPIIELNFASKCLQRGLLVSPCKLLGICH